MDPLQVGLAMSLETAVVVQNDQARDLVYLVLVDSGVGQRVEYVQQMNGAVSKGRVKSE